MTKHGEVIELRWDGGPDAFYIRGHIHFEEAKKIISDYYKDYNYGFKEPIHRYARWSCDGNSEHDHSLMDYAKPGRGRFKITEFERIW